MATESKSPYVSAAVKWRIQELLAKFGADCSEIATIAKDAKLEGRNMSMFLSPKNSK